MHVTSTHRSLALLAVLSVSATSAAACTSAQPARLAADRAGSPAAPVSRLAATKPVAPAAERTVVGAQAWLDHYYAVANYGHHTQDWAPLQALHSTRCGQCDAIPAGSRLAGPGDIRRSPIVGGPAPLLNGDGDQVELVTAVERVQTGGRAQERYIDQVTLTWHQGPNVGWRVERLTFEPYK